LLDKESQKSEFVEVS